ncbi:hypothetical protein BDZ45DRAFT_806672 [Acephala macrosclerotiorum]|nr:hypothetical protein BDZ45DRAFT_806672 [Acephala macrosclerotiorum]
MMDVGANEVLSPSLSISLTIRNFMRRRATTEHESRLAEGNVEENLRYKTPQLLFHLFCFLLPVITSSNYPTNLRPLLPSTQSSSRFRRYLRHTSYSKLFQVSTPSILSKELGFTGITPRVRPPSETKFSTSRTTAVRGRCEAAHVQDDF